MSTLTQHTHSSHHSALQVAEPIGATEPVRRYRRRVRIASRGLTVFDATAVILAALAFATLQASDFRLTAIVVALAVLAKGTAVGVRRSRTTRG